MIIDAVMLFVPQETKTTKTLAHNVFGNLINLNARRHIHIMRIPEKNEMDMSVQCAHFLVGSPHCINSLKKNWFRVVRENA